MDREKVFAMSVGRVFPLLVAKAEKKGRSREEVYGVTCWLTGYSREQVDHKLEADVSYREFFEEAPRMNPNACQIKGSICGVRVEEIEDPLMQKIRYLDKLVDELAKGRPMEKILRGGAEAGTVIREYIAQQREEVIPCLTEVYNAIRRELPDAQEKIAWGMPTFWKGKNIIYFAPAKNHLGLYPGPEAIEVFAEELKNYQTSKGAVRFPYSEPVPLELIASIARWSYDKNSC